MMKKIGGDKKKMFKRKKKIDDSGDSKIEGSDLPKKLPTLTVIIPALNEEKSIADTINSIKGQTYSNITQILVIDDCSSDNTGDIARGCGVEVIRTPENTGTKSQALKFAFPYLRGELTATIDADTIVESRAVETMIEKFVEEPYAAACSFVLPQVRKNFWELGRTIDYLYFIFMRKKTQEVLGIPTVCCGCFSIFNTKTLKDYGYRNDIITEDMEQTWRLLIEKKKVRFIHNAICFPKDPYTLDIYKRQMRRWYGGYFQTFLVHKRDIWKNKKLAIFVYWYLIEGLLGIPFYIILVLSIIFPPTQNLVLLAAGHYLVLPMKFFLPLTYLSSIAIVTIVSLYQASKLKISKIDTLKGIPCYLVLTVLNCAIFFESFIYECILKKKLDVWKKGH